MHLLFGEFRREEVTFEIEHGKSNGQTLWKSSDETFSDLMWTQISQRSHGPIYYTWPPPMTDTYGPSRPRSTRGADPYGEPRARREPTQFKVDLENMTQTNETTSKVRKIRAVVVL